MSDFRKALAKFRESVRRLDAEAKRGLISQDAVNEAAEALVDCWAEKKAELRESALRGSE